MKKLMIAAAIVCATVVAQAAQFDWKTNSRSGGNVKAPEVGALVGGTAYIFESTAAETVLAAFAAGEDWTAGYLDTNTVGTDGGIAVKNKFTYGGEGQAATINAIFAFTQTIGGEDYLYISTIGTATAQGVGAATITFNEKDVSTSIKDANTYAGAGWYSAVPEPTSGLLLLLGVAGLALRRRRA